MWLAGCPGLADEHFNFSKEKEEGRRQPYSRVDRATARAELEAEQPGAYLAFLEAEGCDDPAIDHHEWELAVVT